MIKLGLSRILIIITLFFLGGCVTNTKLDLGLTQQDPNCGGWSSCDKSDTGLKIYGGYKLTKEWALELAYTDFGSVSLRSGHGRPSNSSSVLVLVGRLGPNHPITQLLNYSITQLLNSFWGG